MSGEDLEGAFLPIDDAAHKRGLKVAVWGSEGTGKTHFALTFPEPVYVVDTEMGATPLRKKFKGKTINVMNVLNIDASGEAWESDDVSDVEQILHGLDILLKRPQEEQKGTIVIDSGSDLWNMIQGYGKVKLYKLKPQDRLKAQWDWGPITKIHRTLFKRLLKSRYNLVFTGKVSEVYNGPNPTGVYVGKFQKDVPYLCDVVVKMEKRFINKVPQRVGVIEKCRMNGNIDGKVYPNLTFDTLKKAILGDDTK